MEDTLTYSDDVTNLDLTNDLNVIALDEKSPDKNIYCPVELF